MVRVRKSVLITGGAGFIGSHLCGAFLERGDRVVCLDNFLTGSKANIAPFRSDPRFRLVTHDITRPIRIPGRIDLVFHFASPASPVDYLRYPIKTLKVGSLGTHNTLGLAKAKRARYVLASTSEVYGDPEVHPQPETYWGNVNPTGPRGVYDEAKRFAEALVLAYRRAHRMDAKIARIFNTYGPRMRANDGRVIPNFIGQALAGRPLTVYGKGVQTRSFCYIDDLVRGLAALSESPSGFGGPVNLGNPEEYDILDAAKIILRLTRSRSRLVFRPLPVDDPKRRCPDIRLAKKRLGWMPRIGVEEGLGNTIEYFKSLGKTARA